MKRVIDFIEGIGIKVIITDNLNNPFIDDVQIVNGDIHIKQTTQVSNILHEAGHLAIIPANLRNLANGDLDECFESIFKLTSHLDPEHPIQRALIQCSDTEATAWAWALGKNLGIPEELIIRDEDYEGEGGSIRLMLKSKCYFGINGLAASGMTSINDFPKMKVWTQPAFEFER